MGSFILLERNIGDINSFVYTNIDAAVVTSIIEYFSLVISVMLDGRIRMDRGWWIITILENIDGLIKTVKEVWNDVLFTLSIENNSTDPYRPPSGVGWKKSISLESAIMGATKEIHIKIGHGTSNAYYYK